MPARHIHHDDLANTTYVFGKTFLDRFESHPLRVGSDIFTPLELARDLECTNVIAAQKVSELAEAIGAKSIRDFYNKSTPYSMATSLDRVGVTTLFVAWRMFEARGLDPHKWYARGQAEAVVSFTHFKKREIAAVARARKEERKHRAHTGNAKPAVAHDRATRR